MSMKLIQSNRVSSRPSNQVKNIDCAIRIRVQMLQLGMLQLVIKVDSLMCMRSFTGLFCTLLAECKMIAGFDIAL